MFGPRQTGLSIALIQKLIMFIFGMRIKKQSGKSFSAILVEINAFRDDAMKMISDDQSPAISGYWVRRKASCTGNYVIGFTCPFTSFIR